MHQAISPTTQLSMLKASITAVAVIILVLTTQPAVAATVDNAKTTKSTYAEMPLKSLLELEVFTSASLLPTQTSKAPGTVYSFNRSDFKRYGARRLDELLQFVPGLQLNQYRKRHQAIWARGLIERYNDKMVLLIDGIRSRQLYYNHFSLGDNLALENIEKVEIILGPASSLYGANAFAGIISITTRDFSQQPQFEATLEAGNHQRAKTTLFYNSDNLQGFGSYLSQDAPFRENRKSFIGGESKQPLDEEYQNLRIKSRPIKGLTLSLDYNNNDTPFIFIPSSQNAFIEQRTLAIAASYQYGNLEHGKIEANVYYQKEKIREYELEQVTQSLGYNERQNGWMAGSTITGMKRLHNHVVAGGVSWQHEEEDRMDSIRYFRFDQGFLSQPMLNSLLAAPSALRYDSLLNQSKIENDDYAVFIQDIWTLTPQLELTLGGRYDAFEQFGDYFNYRGALVYSMTDRQTWKLLYGTAIRTPSFREYLKVLENTDVMPPVPDAEHISSVEVNYLYQWDQANLSINLFHNTVKDYIREMPTSDGTEEYFTNQAAEVYIKGVEALVQLRATEKLSLRLGAAYLHTDGDDFENGPYVASWSGSFNADYNYYQQHHLGLSLIYNNNRKDPNASRVDSADAFVITNLFASGPITADLSYTIGVNNLLDSKIYDTAADFPTQYNNEKSERELWIGIQWSPLH